jgi:hypothetical protein
MKRILPWLVIILLVAPTATIGYRVLILDYPFLPSAVEHGWKVSMQAFVKPGRDKVTVRIGYPVRRPGQWVMEQDFNSGRLKFNLVTEGPSRFGEWSGQAGSSGATIGYGALVLNRPSAAPRTKPPAVGAVPAWAGPADQQLAERLVKPWMALAPPERFRAVAAAAAGRWGPTPPDEKDLQAWAAIEERRGKPAALRFLLRSAGLTARAVQGLRLEEGITSSLISWTEVWTGQQWEALVPSTDGRPTDRSSLLSLAIGGSDAARAAGGELVEIRWILSRVVLTQWQSHWERIKKSNRLLDSLSLFHLPAESQETFRILILVPLGALLIGALRNLVGFSTFGVFMPVLMALAFRNTGLAVGLGIFACILLVGFLVRRAIDRLHLLLVPRLSLILTLVIACFIAVALVGNRLARREMMAVGLLPFVILTMTIERFFVIVEEAGGGAAFRAAGGSAAVAAITYLILNVEQLQFVFFVYPELLLVVAAAQMLLGRYTGYRLSELYRFRNLGASPDA